ncbi:MAG: hypothetical protein Q4B92_02365 [Ruminococcus sp.]|nr:hypothetical protein [Ruminococcus sp.]
MAGKDSNKLKNLFFFGVSFVSYDSTDVTTDIITNIRRRFLVTKKPASNKLYRSAQGESFVYSYNFSFDRPLQWRVNRNKKVVEEIEHLLSGKYCINLYDEQGKDLKKTFFDSKHRWFKTNYYSSVSNENLVCSLVPKDFDEGTSLLKYVTGEVYPQRLFACSIPSCDEVRRRVLSRIPTPLVTALTDRGIVYFMPEDDMENYEHVLNEEEEIYSAEIAPEVYVSPEDAATGFNLSAADFDMSKNLNRTFDISLAQDFGSESTDVVDNADVITVEQMSLKKDDSADDGSVDAAISDAVNKINAITSLDINAEDILNFDIDSLDAPAQSNESFEDDYITFNGSDPAIDKQLRHIDSVLEGAPILNAEHRLVIGESVVDDDYISSIIDGIISSAFKGDDEEVEEITDEVNDFSESELSVNLPEQEFIVTAENSDEALKSEETDAVKSEPVDTAEDINNTEEIVSCQNALDFIKANPSDLTIESRGEAYYYYGTVDENGKRSGRGRTLMSDGNIAYEGEYKDDKRMGQGSFYFKDGTLCYWGNWHNNERSGFGVGVSSDDRAVHAGNWEQNKPAGTGARFNSDGSLMFVSSSCEDKKKGFTISDLTDTSFTVRVWSEKDEAFIQREISVNDIIK